MVIMEVEDLRETEDSKDVETSTEKTVDNPDVEEGDKEVGKDGEISLQLEQGEANKVSEECGKDDTTEHSDIVTNPDSSNPTDEVKTQLEDGNSIAESVPQTPTLSEPLDAEAENSQSGSGQATPQRRTRITNNKLMMKSLPQGLAADALFEYRWPQSDDNAEYYMLQEQLAVFLDIKSFKRKYPDLDRRQIDIEERNYLKSVGVVTEMQCDLGLTALKSDEISDLMSKDYPSKYEEYAKVLQKREAEKLAKRQQKLQEQHSNVPTGPVSKSDIKRLTQRAVKAAANYNSFLMKERREERRHYYDIQTGVIQCPVSKEVRVDYNSTPSAYPVAILPGQFTSYYHKYTSDEMKYLPLNSVLHNPPIRIDNPYMPLPVDPSEQPNPAQLQNLNQMMMSSGGVMPGQQPSNVANVPSTVNDAVDGPAVKRPRRNITQLVDSTCCICYHQANKQGQTEKCIKCNQCEREAHPSCYELSDEMLAVVLTYKWMCMECKVCVRCSDPGNEDKMIVCDKCDRGYHTFCVGLKAIPDVAMWACPECSQLKS